MKYLDNLINEITIKQKLEKERKKVNTNPSEKQKENGNYKKGHITINGFEITIENPKGSYRKGVDSNGKEWKVKMNNDYGYFLKSIGYDGDHIDVFLGNDFDSKKIFVIDQKINGKFDESKVMFGFKTSNEAKKAYLSNYEKNWKGFHKITEVDEEIFKSWLYDGKKQRKAFSEYKDMKLNETVNKIVKNLLIESQESKSQSDAIKLLQQKLGWDYEKANNFVRNDLRHDITSLRDKKIAKFTLGVTRMFIGGQLNNESVISELDATLKLLSAHLDDYDKNLNNLSAQELISKFEQTRKDNLERERNEIDSMNFSESNYQIVPINSFEEAKKYYDYTNPIDRWCLTYREDMYDFYTRNGINQIYFCLREGFENVEPIIGENAPLDEYGLSMLSIIVNENGELAYCTTRWNHKNGGSDSAMNAKQISEVVGVNFYQTFKPNNKWEELLASVEQRLANGEDYEDVFDDCLDFHNGFAIVELKGKYNFINREGKLISNQWFDNCLDFHEGFAAVKLNDKWNFINREGKFLSNQWFDDCDYFHEGFAAVELNDEWNFINQKGKLISNQWFYDCGNFDDNGFARVWLKGKCNFINQEGKLISNQWFNGCDDFDNGFAKVRLNSKYNFINQEGELISNQWFDSCDDFDNGFASVELKGKCNFINQEGKLISNKWFDAYGDSDNGFASVKLNGNWYYLNQDGGLFDSNGNPVNINENISKKYKDMKLNETVNKIVKNILFESQESKSQSDAIKLLQQKLGWDYEKANNFVRNDLRNDVTSLRDKKIAKFTLGVTRMFIDGQLNNASVISELNTTLKLLSAHLDEYDRNLNNISAQELISKFEQTRRDNLESERNEIDSMKFSKSNYQIVPINSFEEAEKYYGYTNPNSRWCLTHMENMFDSYTCDGFNQIYFCLREGFKNVKPIVGEKAPLDEYGLSMLSIIVNENGELAYCTTRWNHDNGGSDSAMNAKQISEVVGVNFYQTFKPNNKWNELLASVEQRLANGENYKDVFDYCDDFYNGFARVRLNKKYNFINREGKLISNQWFDICLDFHEGFAAVKLNMKWNFINQEGELLSNQWFDDFRCFDNGFTMVKLNTKYNFINQEGELISNQWFDNYGDFNEGFAAVNLNNKYNFINEEGELLSNQWFDDCYVFNNGFARVKLNKKWNFINQEGELLSNQWFETCDKFYEGLASVKLNGKWYFLTQEGNLYNEDFNPVNINENISKKFKPMKITESKIRRIVNESIKKVLLENKEQTRLTKILIKKLYKVTSSYNGMYRDDDWKHFHFLVQDLKNVPGVENINVYPGKYQRNKDEEMYKPYKLEIVTEFDTMIIGSINCYLNGTMKNPYETYDMVCTFYMDYNNWDN